jgi:hypothetical protein
VKWISSFPRILEYVRGRPWKIIAWVLLALAAGPLSQLGSTLWSSFWNLAPHNFSWPEAIFTSLMLAALVTFIVLWNYERSIRIQAETRASTQERLFSRASAIATKLINMDDSLLRLIPGLVGAKNPGVQDAVHKVLQEYLQDACQLFEENVSRATIFTVDSSEDYLKPWVTYQMPRESIERTKFYIGSEDGRIRGIAGKAYKTKSVLIVRMLQDGSGQWIPSDHDYQNFEPRRPRPPYLSFVAVPILGLSHDCLGILCFDSPSSTAFDSPELEGLWLALGNRIASVMLTYRELVG